MKQEEDIFSKDNLTRYVERFFDALDPDLDFAGIMFARMTKDGSCTLQVTGEKKAIIFSILNVMKVRGIGIDELIKCKLINDLFENEDDEKE